MLDSRVKGLGDRVLPMEDRLKVTSIDMVHSRWMCTGTSLFLSMAGLICIMILSTMSAGALS